MVYQTATYALHCAVSRTIRSDLALYSLALLQGGINLMLFSSLSPVMSSNMTSTSVLAFFNALYYGTVHLAEGIFLYKKSLLVVKSLRSVRGEVVFKGVAGLYFALIVVELGLRLAWADALRRALQTFDFAPVRSLDAIQNIITILINFLSCIVSISFVAEIYTKQNDTKYLRKTGIIATQGSKILASIVIGILSAYENASARGGSSMACTHVCNWLMYQIVVDDVLSFVPLISMQGARTMAHQSGPDRESAAVAERVGAQSSNSRDDAVVDAKGAYGKTGAGGEKTTVVKSANLLSRPGM